MQLTLPIIGFNEIPKKYILKMNQQSVKIEILCFMQDLPSWRTNLTVTAASANIDKLAPKVNARCNF